MNHLSVTVWDRVRKVSEDAAVFIDGGAAEVLHWAGGIQLLGRCVGVYDLYDELNPVARNFIATAPFSRVVIIVTTFLHGPTSEKICHVLSDLHPLECHVFCSRSEHLHNELLPMGDEERWVEDGSGLGLYSHYGEFQALLRKWIKRESGVRVSVSYIPLFQCEVCPDLFVTPPYSALFPLIPSDIEHIQACLISEGDSSTSLEHLYQVDFTMLSHEHQINLKSFAYALNELLHSLDMREELFSLGCTSRFIANQLTSLPAARTRRKSATKSCSLLLVDRTLDLSGPASHLTDSLADRILSLLPHATPTSCDVAVNMSHVATEIVLPGRLAQPHSAKAQQLLKTIINSKQKESLMQVSRCLLDAISQESLSIKLTGKLGRPSAQQLQAFLQLFKDNPKACVSQSAVLQIACAVVQSLEGPHSKHWEKLASIEKLLLLSVSDKESPSVVQQLTDLIKQQLSTAKKDQEQISLCDVLGLAVFMFSLLEDGCLQEQNEEREMKEALCDLILEKRKCDEDIVAQIGIDKSDSRIHILGRLSTLFQRLLTLSEIRTQFQQFRHTYLPDSPGPLPYVPLLSQLVEAIFHPSQSNLSDLDYHSQGSTAANILKSGFSLFVSSARPRPNQQPMLIVFVVGGVMCSEVRQIQETLAMHKTDVKVNIGSTKLLTQSDITTQLLRPPT